MTTLLLKDYLAVNDCTQTRLSNITGVTPQLINYWLKKGKEDAYVEYNVVTGEILRLYTQKVLFRAKTKWDVEKEKA